MRLLLFLFCLLFFSHASCDADPYHPTSLKLDVPNAMHFELPEARQMAGVRSKFCDFWANYTKH